MRLRSARPVQHTLPQTRLGTPHISRPPASMRAVATGQPQQIYLDTAVDREVASHLPNRGKEHGSSPIFFALPQQGGKGRARRLHERFLLSFGEPFDARFHALCATAIADAPC